MKDSNGTLSLLQSSRFYLVGCLVFCWLSLLLSLAHSEEVFVLPGAKKATTAPQKTISKQSFPPPNYSYKKEWQSYRSTSQVTTALIHQGSIWAGTANGNLIRWNLATKGYRFYLPFKRRSATTKVHALVMTKQGDLWIGTHAGLAFLKKGEETWRFLPDQSRLPSPIIQALALTSSGDLWIGTPLGIACKGKNGQWTHYSTKNGLPANDIQSIGITSNERIWFSPALSTPFYIKGKTFVSFPSFPIVGANCIVSDRKGGVWFCHNQGAIHLPYQGKPISYTTQNGLSGGFVNQILVDRKGNVWIGTKGHGLTLLKNESWTRISTSKGAPGNDIRAIVELTSGEIVVGSHLNGFSLFDNNKWHRLPVGIAGNRIQTIAHSPHGEMWIGTASGASRYFRGYWYNYTQELPHLDVRAFVFDPAGHTWVGTYGGGIGHFDGKKWKTIETFHGIASNRVIGAGLTPEGLWFAHEQKGISRFQRGKWTVFSARTMKSILSPTHFLKGLYVDHQYGIWLSSKGGGAIVHPFGGSWRRVPHIQGTDNRNVVNGIAVDQQGQRWFATKNGLYVLKNKTLKRFSTENGLPDLNVLAVTVDRDKVWVGTAKGVATYDGSSWRTFTKDQGLVDDHITSIAVTSFREKWFGSLNDGITIYRGE